MTGGLPGPRPQPIGALPWPAGLLVLPDVPGAAEAASRLVLGQNPERWPAGLEFFRAALRGDAPLAAGQLTAPDPVSAYNRAVLVGGEQAWAQVRAEPGSDLAVLAATARFSVGLTDQPPEPGQSVAGEVNAVARSARAAAALERGDAVAAVDELAAAVTDAAGAGSPVLAATLAATRADLLRDRIGDPAAAVAAVDAALRTPGLPAGLTSGHDETGNVAAEVRAELHLTRALARQQLAAGAAAGMPAVVADLTEALKVFREDSHPELFATASQHLGMAYLTMPMSSQGDRLRVGVAVGCLRAALRVFTPEHHPLAWSSAQLNLANALQYLPSAHIQANLEEATRIYQELLSYRDEAGDPVGVARILLNQANALGHLGAFEDARDRLNRARTLFGRAGDAEGIAAADEIQASIEAALAGRS